MMQEENVMSLQDILEIGLRRKWYIISPFCLVMIISVLLCFTLPKIYKASTTILVIPQEVPADFVRPTVTMNPSDYVNVISQEIMSRTRLEIIINELSLFPELINTLPMEKIIEKMRKKIEIDLKTDQGRKISTFTVSYTGKNPEQVATTANRLATLFIEENLKSREQQARKTTVFLKDELLHLKATLENQEGVLSEFKQRHLSSLPEQRDANLKMLEQLVLQRQRIADELNDAQNRKIIIQQQFMQPNSYVPSAINQENELRTGTLDSRINAATRKLAELQSKYTNEHPDVIAAQAELNRLTAQSGSEKNKTDNEPINQAESGMNAQILALNLQIKGLQNEDAAIKAEIAEYQSRVEMAPKLEQELTSLMRDYENTKKSYDVLMEKRMAAEQAEKLEMNKQGEQFKVLDPAQVPLVPFKPDKQKVFLIGFMLALASGFGLAYFAENRDNSFHTIEDIVSYLNLPVLVSIPQMESQNDKTPKIRAKQSIAQ